MGAPAYHSTIRETLVERMRAGETRTALHWETGIPVGTLSRWMRSPVTFSGVSPKPLKPAAPSILRSTRQWSLAEKLRVLAEVQEVSDADRGELYRREGVHEADLKLWRAELEDVLTAQRLATSKLSRDIAALTAKYEASQRELREAKALLELKKKFDAMFGPKDEADVTPPSTDEPSKQ